MGEGRRGRGLPLLQGKTLCTSLWKGKGADWFKRRSPGIADLVHSYIFSDPHTPQTCEASRQMGSIPHFHTPKLRPREVQRLA